MKIIISNVLSVQITCIGDESCEGTIITLNNVESSIIECWSMGACDNIAIKTNNWNKTKLIMKEYSKNVIYNNGYGLNILQEQGFINLECNLEDYYIRFDVNNINDILLDMIRLAYNSGNNLPCNGIKIQCGIIASAPAHGVDTEEDLARVIAIVKQTKSSIA